MIPLIPTRLSPERGAPVPAHRSRTSDWRRCLEQVCERNGALEIAVARSSEGDDGESRHLVWRVRLVSMTEQEILVEQPTTLGQVIHLEPGIELVAILAIGQNRWMFPTTNLGLTSYQLNDHKTISVLRLVMPESVERCQRRNYYRLETAALILPEVEIWPLLDPKSVLLAERAAQLQFEADEGSAGQDADAEAGDFDDDATMPEVGPKFTATLLNIGGGGVGLRVAPQDAPALTRLKVFWLRFSLPPGLTTPICATAKLVHTHVDSTQHTYAGMAFDFSFNPIHQRLVVDQICRYIAIQQRAQLKRQAERDGLRQSA